MHPSYDLSTVHGCAKETDRRAIEKSVGIDGITCAPKSDFA